MSRASKKYEKYSLITDLFEKYKSYKKQNNLFINVSDPENNALVNQDSNDAFLNNNIYLDLQNTKSEIINNEKNNTANKVRSILKPKGSININNLNDEESENEFSVKKEIIDLVEIDLFQNNENKYIFDLSKYNKKVKKSVPEFVTFGLLDIDPKINIKSYQNFNYNKLYNRYVFEVFLFIIFIK